MDNKIRAIPLKEIHCACVIHGDAYSWDYVEKLHNSLQRNLTPTVILHVYTEASRVVPSHMVKHSLIDWPGIAGPKKAWWYKIQLFNTKNYSGQLLYFDLDTVIINNIDWVWQLDTNYFWAAKDFRYLFDQKRVTINSSVMWFDVKQFEYVYNRFELNTSKHYHGDQDYIHAIIPAANRRYMDTEKISSWRWEVFDGGFDFKTRKPLKPDTGATIAPTTDIIVFHGKPKPHEVADMNILTHWK